MRIQKLMTAEAVLTELGRRISRRRLDLGMTQAAAAEEAGLSKRTVEHIESGDDIRVTSLIRYLNVLDLIDGLNSIVPETEPRPMEVLRMKGMERQRASSKQSQKLREEWHWGNQQ